MGGAVPACPAAYPAARPWTPLALTLGLHLLLVLAWLGARGDPGRERAYRLAGKPPPASVFVPVRPPSLPPAQRTPQAAAAHASLRRARPPAAATLSLSTPSSTAADTTPAQTVSAPASETAANAEGQAGPAQADTAPTALRGDLLARSKAMAWPADRALRKGVPPVMAAPERKWERFAEAVASAHIDTSRTAMLESYTAPDGVVVYRTRVGNRVSCYRSGSVGGLATGFGAADGHGAGSTSCPTGVSWTRH